ncbi:MAG TPA: hypothetical protein VEI49_03775, partial [Terriglobales bacterium]|nr:hypothetical protein [Terriglobales bacterium]
HISFEGATSAAQVFTGPVTMVTFGSGQYMWHSDGVNSHADPESSPVSSTISADAQTSFLLPQASVTVLRGKIGSF